MSFRDYIQKNHWWKLLSLLLASLTWFTIQTGVKRDQSPPQSSISARNTLPFPSLPIRIMAGADDRRGFKVSPGYVAVTVIGKEEKLAALLPQAIGVYVDLTGTQGADRLRREVQVRVPDGVIVVSVVPDKVDVEPIATAEAPARR